MTQIFTTKTTIAGDYAESITHEKPRSIGWSRTYPVTKKAHNRTRRQDSIRRAQKQIRLLTIANSVNEVPTAITTTYVENQTDRKQAQQDTVAFIRKLRRKYGTRKYLYVLERQKRGAWHAHILVFNPTFIPKDDISRLWTKGSTRVERVRRTQLAGNYVGKYISKEVGNVSDVHSFSRSRGTLVQPDVVYTKGAFASHGWRKIDTIYKYGTLEHITISIYMYGQNGSDFCFVRRKRVYNRWTNRIRAYFMRNRR